MTNYREILRLSGLGFNYTKIAESTGITRQTAATVLRRAEESGISYDGAANLSDRELAQKLNPQGSAKRLTYKIPDYEEVHRELQKPGVTIMLLWMEYCEKCRQCGELPYQETQFRKYYHEFTAQTKATMHLNRKPGELMEVDWAGTTAKITDNISGVALDVYIFVAVLPYSNYGYAEAFWDMTQSSWLAGHVSAYEHFGGATRILVPDNLKASIIKHTKNEIVLNRAYQEMAEHYGTAVIPTRVRTPKDKAAVEGTVGIITTYIIAATRNEKFFSLSELNEVIKKRLHDYNHKPFQRRDGSRASLFADERQFLIPLPKTAYELSEWRIATVQNNYHVLVDDNYYSVPFEYIKQKVDIRLTRSTVEIFFDNRRISSHIRITGKRGGYVTREEHMPPNHREYIKWNGDRFRQEAALIGSNTVAVVKAILANYKVEQQGYKSCLSLLKIAETHSPKQLESACERALTYTASPSLKVVLAMMKSGLLTNIEETPALPSKHSFTRGANYYGDGGKK
jgi:transposase